MPETTLVARAGRSTGTRGSRRLRTTGEVPGVIYGHGVTPTPISVDGRQLRAALSGPSGTNALLALRVDGTTHLTMAWELQRHPVRGTLQHVDFLVVRRDQVVEVDVPVVLTGEAEAVQRADGMVEQLVFSLSVRAVPSGIPEGIEVDVTALEIGEAIRVGDLTLPAGVATDTDPERTLVVGHPPQVSAADLGEEPAEAEAEEVSPAAEAGQDGASGTEADEG
ncbi:MAG TPA: 50S ribosomal protein L25 [Acidimicrobiales bacterium]|jgi:large subunit ribosomal protein L25|nr:50S ribosomal protein L25 [Acidimicrobiales bacterium]